LRNAARFRARSTSHTVAVRDGCTNIPLAAGRAQEDENLSRKRPFRPRLASVRPPGSVRTDHVPRITVLDDVEDGAYRQAGLIMAPSITTPALTYFQSATSSFRASATIVVLRRRPLLRSFPSWNQRVVRSAADSVSKARRAESSLSVVAVCPIAKCSARD
jgi:hypothetical protein